MKIILSIKNSLGKNVAFVTDNFKIFLLAEILELTRQNQIDGVYLVNKSRGSYLRSKKSVPKNLQLDNISIGSDGISSIIDLRISGSTPILSAYTVLYNKSLSEGDSPIIKPVESNLYASTAIIKEKLLSVRETIYESATHFNLDPFQIGAILNDLINNWKEFIDLKSHFGILASLYSMYKLPHENPQSNERGNQIASEFYNLAKVWLS